MGKNDIISLSISSLKSKRVARLDFFLKNVQKAVIFCTSCNRLVCLFIEPHFFYLTEWYCQFWELINVNCCFPLQVYSTLLVCYCRLWPFYCWRFNVTNGGWIKELDWYSCWCIWFSFCLLLFMSSITLDMSTQKNVLVITNWCNRMNK